jgi:plastocyanin
MKIFTRRHPYLIFLFVSATCQQLSATIHIIQVQRSAFVPATLQALAGDTIQWVWQSGKHTLKSIRTPKGASAWKANINSKSKTFQLVLWVPGKYEYISMVGHSHFQGSISIDIAPAAAQLNADTTIKIYPLPFKNSLTIDMNNAGIFKSPVNIEIFDALGQSKFHKSSEQVLISPLTLKLPDWPAGYYFMNLSDKVTKRTYRIIKE